MADVVFAFGPNGSYFYESSTKWVRTAIPENLEYYFKQDESQPKHCSMNYVYTMTLGADNSYYATYYAKDGKNYEVFQSLPDELVKWLRQKEGVAARDLRTIRISLGPGNKSFFAYDKNGYWWWNLPDGLKTAMDQIPRNKKGALVHEESPRIVTLGVNGTYLLVKHNGGGSWDLKNEYPEFEAELTKIINANGDKGGAFNSIHYANLDPHTAGHYAMLTTSNEFTGDFEDASIENVEQIVASIHDTSTAKSTPGTAGAAAGKSRSEKLAFTEASMSILASGVQILSALGGGGGGGAAPSGGYSGGGGA